MSLGAISSTSKHGRDPASPTPTHVISFTGDSSYPTGGTTGFAALVQAAVGAGVTPLFVVPVGLSGGYCPIYDKANDTLMMVTGNAEIAGGTNLGSTTFKLAVYCE